MSELPSFFKCHQQGTGKHWSDFSSILICRNKTSSHMAPLSLHHGLPCQTGITWHIFPDTNVMGLWGCFKFYNRKTNKQANCLFFRVDCQICREDKNWCFNNVVLTCVEAVLQLWQLVDQQKMNLKLFWSSLQSLLQQKAWHLSGFSFLNVMICCFSLSYNSNLNIFGCMDCQVNLKTLP